MLTSSNQSTLIPLDQIERPAVTDAQRKAFDDFPTPAWAVTRFFEAWQPRGSTWLEPAAGRGSLLRAAMDAGFCREAIAVELQKTHVDHFDLELRERGVDVRWGDCLCFNDLGPVDLVIGNPPFRWAEEIIKLSLTRFGPSAEVAMYLRLSFFSSAKRRDWLEATKPDVYVLPDRVPHEAGGNTDMVGAGWFVWSDESAGRWSILGTTPSEERARDHLALWGAQGLYRDRDPAPCVACADTRVWLQDADGTDVACPVCSEDSEG